MGERQRGVLRRRQAVQEGCLHAREVEPRALGLAPARPRHEGPVARAHELLELGLGVAQRARGAVCGLGAELERLILGDARQAERRALPERGVERVRLHVEVVGVVVVEARSHVLPEVAEGGRELFLGGHRHERVLRQQVEQLAEAVHRQHVGDVRALRLLARGRDLGELTVLRSKLRRGRDLDRLRLLERALGEGREPGEPLDLDVEQLAANGALLGGRVDVEDVPADRELAALLNLVDALVAARDELRGRLVEVDEAALGDLETLRAQVGVGHLLGERARAGDEHGGLLPEQRVERGDTQPDEMRRRREMRLVAHAARRVEAHPARTQKGPQVGGQVTGGAVVAGHDERGPLGLAVDQRRQQVGAHARRHEGTLRTAARGGGERLDRGVVLCVCEEAPEHALRPPGATARLFNRFYVRRFPRPSPS